MKKFFLIIIFIICTFFIYSQTDTTNDEDTTDDINTTSNQDPTDDLDWLQYYINLDPSDDVFYQYKLKNYTISKEYVENLQWNQEIDFFIDAIDEHNLRKNINALPRFPYIFIPYGGYSYNRGFDIGFLFRADNFLNSRVALTAATSFGQKGKLWVHTNIEYPALLNNRLKLFGTLSFFTTYPQYASKVSTFPSISSSSSLMKLFNKIWKKLDIDFYKQSEFGFYFIPGIDYRIPIIDLKTITNLELMYKYDHLRVGDIIGSSYLYDEDYLPEQILIDKSNLSFNIRQEFRWNKLKQTESIPVGMYLSFWSKFYLPTTIGIPNDTFRFKSRFEGRFAYKIFREFAVRARALLAINYNISEDFSGDPYIRGLADQELTGWFGFLGNIELYVPVVNVTMKAAADVTFKRDAKFILFWTLFLDGGFTVENYNYYLDNFIERMPRERIRNSLIYGDPLGQTYIKGDNYLLPSVTVGSGLRIYSYFLPFIIRLDVAMNILKAASYRNGAECIEVVLSFSEMF